MFWLAPQAKAFDDRESLRAPKAKLFPPPVSRDSLRGRGIGGRPALFDDPMPYRGSKSLGAYLSLLQPLEPALPAIEWLE